MPKDMPGQPGAMTLAYAAPPGAMGMAQGAQRPGKGLRVTGGVLTIIAGALNLIIGGVVGLLGYFTHAVGSAVGTSGHDFTKAMGSAWGDHSAELSKLGVTGGEVATAGTMILVAGIAGAVLGLVGIIMGAMCAAGKPGGAIGGGIVMLLAAGAAVSISSWFLLALSATGAVFCFVGLKQCKEWQAYKAAGGR
jgi:hypothetical protein